MRFAKPVVVSLVSAALLALPLSGAALADAHKPQPTTTLETPRPANSTPQPVIETPKAADVPAVVPQDRRKKTTLEVSVEPSHVRAGASYEVTIVAKGASSRTAMVTSPEGKTYRVALSGGRATKTLTLPANTKPGKKTVTVKVGNKVATESFTVVGGKRDQRDDRRHDGR